MKDAECIELLQWALPRLGMRWPGFRKVRKQVCKRVSRRMAELVIDHVRDYRRYLEDHQSEWARLDAMCRITISRFYRDRGLFDRIVDELGRLAEDTRRLAVWSAGCAGGEEPYTVAILWQARLAERHPDVGLEILATDAEPVQLSRAERACYQPATLRELPDDMRRAAFVARDDQLCLRPELRGRVRFERQDLRDALPSGPFDLVLCRYLAFTYFDEPLQRRIAEQLAARVTPGGLLAIGNHEKLPAGVTDFERLGPEPLYRRR